jgi:hypothetical protein
MVDGRSKAVWLDERLCRISVLGISLDQEMENL